MEETGSPLTDTIVAIAVIAIVAYFIVKRVHAHQQKSYLRHHSTALAQLPELNASWSPLFAQVKRPKRTYSRTLNSKRAFDNFDPRRTMRSIIREEYADLHALTADVNGNIATYTTYSQRCDALLRSDIPSDELPRCFSSADEYRELEKKLLHQSMLSPTRDITVTLNWSYTSPKGRNHYANSHAFHLSEISGLIAEVEQAEAHEQTTQYQRDLMTPSLRFEIMKRDGYRCRLCGRSADDGAQLEVDHIVPVSKGGKTEPSNLQTLCWDCNRGKGARDL